MPKISICIPFHQTSLTASYLSRLLNSIHYQTFKDYEIILTSDGQFARNHNVAITKATGEYVQMLQMDDRFASPDSLEKIVRGLEESGKEWQISGSIHDINGQLSNQHKPIWTDNIWTGNNRLGSVSTLSFKRTSGLLFEEPLTWLVDCDLYYRFFLKYGEPNTLNEPLIVVDTRDTRLSSTLSDELKVNEIQYLRKKYG